MSRYDMGTNDEVKPDYQQMYNDLCNMYSTLLCVENENEEIERINNAICDALDAVRPFIRK